MAITLTSQFINRKSMISSLNSIHKVCGRKIYGHIKFHRMPNEENCNTSLYLIRKHLNKNYTIHF